MQARTVFTTAQNAKVQNYFTVLIIPNEERPQWTQMSHTLFRASLLRTQEKKPRNKSKRCVFVKIILSNR